MLPPLKKWLRKQPYQQVRPDKEAVHCHTFEKMAAQTALSAGGVCRSASPRACRLRGLPPPARGISRSASPPPPTPHTPPPPPPPPASDAPVPALCAAPPLWGGGPAAPHPPRACRARRPPPPERHLPLRVPPVP